MKFVEKRNTPSSTNVPCERQPKASRLPDRAQNANIIAAASANRQQIETGGAGAKLELTLSAYHDADQHSTVVAYSIRSRRVNGASSAARFESSILTGEPCTSLLISADNHYLKRYQHRRRAPGNSAIKKIVINVNTVHRQFE